MIQRRTTRGGTRTRRLRTAAGLVAAVALTTAGCASGKAGTAIPDGDQAAEYVTAKFSTTLESLADDIRSGEPRMSTHRSFTRIGDKKADVTTTAIQVGDPPSRLYKNHSNRDSSDYRDYFHPAGSDVEYTRLGPVYSSLAPTEWVSMPYTAGNLDPCYWGGYLSVCRMLDTISESVKDQHAAKSAKSFADGRVVLDAKVTLREFLDQRVVIIPDWALAEITEKMKGKLLDTRVSLSPDGKLDDLEMTGKITDGDHEIQVDEHYQLQDAPTEDDLPPVPSGKEVTALKTDKQVDDFYDRMGQITSSGG